MFKFISIIFQLSILLVIVLFIANNSFVISFEINDLIYSISSSFLFIFILLFIVFIFLIQSIFFKTKYKLLNYKVKNKIKNKEKSYDSFVNGMIALANKDFKKAIKESKKISGQLDDNLSLSLLLRSEVYKIEKKYDELNLVYEAMIKNNLTQNLGYRGIMEQYLRSQDYHHAFIYGEKLFNNNPYVEKIYDTLLNIIVKTNNWQQLLIITDKAYTKKIIDKKIFQENKSIAFFEIAKIKQYSEINESINYIKKALNLRKNFPPYIRLYLELLIQNKNYIIAKKYIKKVWKDIPHPEYKLVINNLSKYLEISMLELTKYIIGTSATNEESKLLFIEASILDEKWNEARSEIKSLIDVKPKKEVCLLMAKIEEGDTGDMQKTNSWILRARNGEENKIWICFFSNRVQEEWSAISNGGFFNSLEWKKPIMINSLISSED